MLQRRMITEQTRQELVKSNLNYSRSKQLWTFSKKQRFQLMKSQCPIAFYQHSIPGKSSKKISFATSLRRVFTESTEGPLPGAYNIDSDSIKKTKKGFFFGQSRQKCLNNSYISQDHLKNPGPSDYRKLTQKVKGVTMRPKTANHRNYFIDDKEKTEVPSPFSYNPSPVNKEGRSSNSKLHSTILGWAGLMKKQPRFQVNHNKNPGPSNYSPEKVQIGSKSIGGCIGSALRQSFIDKIRKCNAQPGPGEYSLPTEFGHYKKVSSISNKSLTSN